MILLWSAAALFSADFLPLQFGNNWTYREANSGQTFTVRVSTPILTNGRVYHSLMGYTMNTLLVRMNEQGQLVYLHQDSGQERVLTSFEPFERGWWEAPFRPCSAEGQTREARGTFDGPTGPIREVLEIHYRNFTCADTGLQSEQYAENIGMVRRTMHSFVGPRRFDLVSARVGQMRIEASPSGRFNVSVTGAEGNGAITATLRLDVQSEHPLVLEFPSSQEYELELRNGTGQVVWRWSDGRFFAQALHQRTIAGEWLTTVNIPRPAAAIPAGAYTLHAWMTTTGTPRFAATVPLTITPH
jgi:hypothetical protein